MITVETTGFIRFEIHLPHAQRVEIVGDFTAWERSPVPMDQSDDGWWEACFAVTPGDHRFRYRIDGSCWLTDFAAHGVSLNEFGEWNSELIEEFFPEPCGNTQT